MANRQLCVVIDFSVMPAKPKPSRVDEFIEKDVQLDWSKVRGLQLNNITSYVFIKMDTIESAEQLAEEHNLKHTMEHKDITYRIPFFIADGATDVKLHDLPFDMPNHIIAEQMTQFGEVLSIKDDYWRNLFHKVPNGVRIARMRISKPIPSYISISTDISYMTLVTHKNQIPTCRHCSRRVHYTMKCSEYAKSLREEKTPKAPIETGHQTTAMSTSRDISPNERYASIEDEIPMPVLTPANTAFHTTETTAETCAAAAVVVAHSVAAVTAHSATAAAASPTAQLSSQLDQEVINSPKRNQREISKDNQRTRNDRSESAFKRPGSPKTAESKRPSRSKNRH